MTEPKVDWKDGSPEQVRCVRCLQLKDELEVDRLLWCDDCKRLARHRAGSWGWVAGVVFGAAVAAYVWFVVHASFVIPEWIATIAAAVWVTARLSREVVYAGMRFLNTRGVEAAPSREGRLR